jgi:AraC family transcriptional regulator
MFFSVVANHEVEGELSEALGKLKMTTFDFADSSLEMLLLALRSEMLKGNPSGPLYGEGVGLAICSYLAHGLPSPRIAVGTDTAAVNHKRVQRTQDFMRDNVERAITLTELAAHAGLSRYHFIRAFKSVTGTTPFDYLMQARVERAKTLLGSTDIPLAEISLRCGFSSQSHMTATFAKLLGVTPARWRSERRWNTAKLPNSSFTYSLST